MNKNWLTLPGLLLLAGSFFAQPAWRLELPGYLLHPSYVSLSEENGHFLVASGSDFIQIDPYGTPTGHVPSGNGAIIHRPWFEKKYSKSTGYPYFLTGTRTIGVPPHTLTFEAYRPGTGVVQKISLVDTMQGLSRPLFIPLNDSTYMIFGQKKYWKIKHTEHAGFEVLWTKPLSMAPTAVLFQKDRFVVAEESGIVTTMDENGSVFWSRPHGVVFRSLKHTPDGVIGCGVTSGGNAAVLKIGADGTEIWRTVTTDKCFYDIVETAGGGYAAVGETATNSILLTRINASGQVLENLTYGRGFGMRLLQAGDGGFLLAARGGSPVKSQLIKTDRNGQSELSASPANAQNRILKTPKWKTTATPTPSIFFDGYDSALMYPDENGLMPVWGMSPQIGGYGPDDNLHLAIDRFGLGYLKDYRHGWASTHPSDFSRVWLLTKKQIAEVRRDYGDNGTFERPIPYDLLTWPAKGNPHLRYNPDFSPVKTNPDNFSAPFVDANGDGLYNAMDGDFPVIKGDYMAWYMLTDSLEKHTWSNTRPLVVDIVVSIYGYDCVENELIENAAFVDFNVINRSPNTYKEVYMGLFTDFMLGCGSDDFIGSLPEAHTYYAYNKGTQDAAACMGNVDWAGAPPVCAATFLNQNLNIATSYLPLVASYDPSLLTDFYSILKGVWLTRGGTGYNPGSTNFVKHIFPDNPPDPNGWSMCNLNLPPLDVRAIGTHGPFTFAPGDTFSLTTAFTLHSGIPHPCPDIFSTLGPALQQLRDWNEEGLLAGVQNPGQLVSIPVGQRTLIEAGIQNAATYTWSTKETTAAITVEKAGMYTVTITSAAGCRTVNDVLVRFEQAGAPAGSVPDFFLMPNPADSYIGVNCPECLGTARLRASLHNAQGQLVRTAIQTTGAFFQIAVHDLPAGFYALQLWQDEQYLGGKKVLVLQMKP